MGEGRVQIFHLEAGGRLVALAGSPFALEDHLGTLIADYPELTPADQVAPESPRRWRLVGRQVAILGDATSWAHDLLLVDQGGIPTIVELKKGSDTELRRKVVGQPLDCAANAPNRGFRSGDRFALRAAQARSRAPEPPVLAWDAANRVSFPDSPGDSGGSYRQPGNHTALED